ncbi:hypothetical protein A3K70_04505 [Candidatus Bathyarchaeota archaeon RBG_16_48_13]|nr:MAG: hypothetical protein A3K70_04505 [Candidatus Bathyarchaeota archaeon RBG_16_48_13]
MGIPMREHGEERRKFGIVLVGDIPWGTHLCQFYETKQDLIEILVPYFAEGLKNNEFCMWITSPPLEVEEARQALLRAVPDLDEYSKKGQIELLSYRDWHLLDGEFDSKSVLQSWVEKEEAALKRGFEGLRLTGNTFWVERKLWKSFVDYEEAINSVIGEHRMMALCTYCLQNCTGTDVLDVVRNHIGTLVRQGDEWYLVEDAARRKAVSGALKLSDQKYRTLLENMEDGFAYHRVLFDEARKPVDYVFLEVNDAFERLTGLQRENVVGRRVTEILPGMERDTADWINVYGRTASPGEPMRFDSFSASLGRWYMVSAFCTENDHFVATFEDITERKKTEQLVRESEGRYRVLVDSAPDAILVHREGNLLYANPAALELYGAKSFDELASHNLLELVPSEDVEKSADRAKKVMNGHKLPLREARIIRLDGKIIPVEVISNLVEYGGDRAIQAIIRDVSERMKSEEEIRQRDQQLQDIIDNSPGLVFIKDLEGRFIKVNARMAQLYGVSQTAFVGKTDYDLGSKEKSNYYRAIDRQVIESGESKLVEEEDVYRDGLRRVWLTYKFPLHDAGGRQYAVCGISTEITERKKTEEALIQSLEREQLLGDLVRHASVAVVVGDLIDRILMVNRAFEDLTGYSEEELLRNGWKTPLNPPEFIKLTEAKLAEVRRTGKSVHYEKEYVRKDSSRVPIELVVNPFFDKDGNVSRYFSFITDITERKKAGEEIDRLASFPALNPNPVVEVDFGGNVWFVNPATEAVFPDLKKSGLSHPFFSNWEGVVKAFMDEKKTNFGKEERIGDHWYHQQFYLAQKGQRVRIYAVNIDEKKQAENQLRTQLEEYSKNLERTVEEKTKQLSDAERLATIGQTAGMVGHDLRNPLQTIEGAIYLTKEELKSLPPEDKVRQNALETLSFVEEQTNYMNKIVQDLQDFVRPITPQAEMIEVRRMVKNALRMLEIPNNVKVSSTLKDVARIVADPQLMTRVLYNLIANALQAMPMGGKLMLSARTDDGAVLLSVSDTGVGIPDNVKAKIFTPLFTTKAKGQGFGLAVAKRLVEAHDGTITFESEAGKGTTFKIRIPRGKVR